MLLRPIFFVDGMIGHKSLKVPCPDLRLALGFLMLVVSVTSSGADAASYDGTHRTADQEPGASAHGAGAQHPLLFVRHGAASSK
jgi:hypothetical protein